MAARPDRPGAAPSRACGTRSSTPYAPGSRPPATPRRPCRPTRARARHGARRTARRPRGARARHRRRPLRAAAPPRTLALLAAGLPGAPGTVLGHGTGAGERLLAVTFNDLVHAAAARPSWNAPGLIAANPRLHHVVVAAGEEALPYAALESGPLTDEPGPVPRHRRTPPPPAGRGQRGPLRRARRPSGAGRPSGAAGRPAAWTGADATCCGPSPRSPGPKGPRAHSLFVPLTVYRAARRLARTPYRTGLEDGRAPCCPTPTVTPPTSTPRSTPRSPPSPGPGPGRPRAGSPGRLSRKYRFVSRTAAIRPASVQRPGEARARAALARHAADHRIFEQAAEIRSQRLHAPFLDNQVVRACPRPAGIAAGPAGRPRRDPAPGPRGRRHPRPAARLGHAVTAPPRTPPRPHRPACRPSAI